MNSKHNPKYTGQAAENSLIGYLSSRGWALLARNKQFAHVEIDSFWRSTSGRLFIVECKSLRSPESAKARLSKRQAARLQVAALCLSGKCNEPVSVLLALVSAQGAAIDFYDELGEWVEV